MSTELALDPAVGELQRAYVEWETVGERIGSLASRDPQFGDQRWGEWWQRYLEMTDDLATTCATVSLATGQDTWDLWAGVTGWVDWVEPLIDELREEVASRDVRPADVERLKASFEAAAAVATAESDWQNADPGDGLVKCRYCSNRTTPSGAAKWFERCCFQCKDRARRANAA